MSQFIAKNQGTSILVGALICGLFNVVLIVASPAFAAAVELSAR
jgi:hypothetical protein